MCLFYVIFVLNSILLYVNQIVTEYKDKKVKKELFLSLHTLEDETLLSAMLKGGIKS